MAVEESAGAALQTFLIADVRGYTRFTQEHGDEAGARLAAKFASVAREEIESYSGSLVELRGDEALAVFSSARQAVRAALALQQRLRAETEADSSLPFKVGIGLDAGEAVAVERGFRGGALNLAARLCSTAAAGEVLASEGVVHLARKIDGVVYRDRGRVRLKGIDKPVRIIQPLSEDEAVVRRARLSATARTTRTMLAGRRGRVGTAAVAAIVVAVVVLVFALGSSGVKGLPGVQADAAAAIDPGSGKITHEVAFGTTPGPAVYGAGSVWVANVLSGSVSRVDIASRSVRDTIQLGGNPSALAFGAGALWVAVPDTRQLMRINPASDTVVDRVGVGNGPSGVAFGGGRVWVANRLDDSTSVVDPTNDRARELPAGATPNGIAFGLGSVWTTSDSTASVARIDPKSGSVQTIAVGNGPNAVAIGAGAAWVTNALDGTVSRIDPTTNAVAATIPVGRDPIAVAATESGVWVASSEDESAVRIDAAANRVDETVQLRNAPQGIASTSDGIWVTARAGAASHRGGTLRVLVPTDDVGSMDPVSVFGGFTGPLLATNDGLVGFRRVSGVEGATLVPDLATSLPAPQDGGRTYTFRLRSGIHYSDGRLVRASDIGRAVRRAVSPVVNGRSGEGAYLSGIIGAAQCLQGKRCDLSRGVITDDATGTVTFHLASPDPEFLYKLAQPPADAVPPGTPMHDVGTHPVPATGPYKIARYVPNKELLLVRNPHFRVWSAAAQPAGYPDRIDFRLVSDANKLLHDVEAGKADWTSSIPPGRVRELQTRFTAQLHLTPGSATHIFFLNSRVPPFDKVAARRAVEYAIDRSEVVRIVGGPTLVAPTCQILPPGFPGYRPYCPYTVNPTATGTWTGPDLARARSLVRESGTKGARVTVWTFSAPGEPPVRISRYVVRVLDSIGYRASLRVMSIDDYFPATSDSRTKAQIGFWGWATSLPTASDFFQPTLSCSAFAPNDPNNSNVAEFCDRKIDEKMKQAFAKIATEPAASKELWAEVDRDVTDQAPWVPLFTDRTLVLTSRRVGNYQESSLWGPLFTQLWVR